MIFVKRKSNPFDDELYNITNDDFGRIKIQMNILIYGYAIVSTLTLIWFIIFPYIFNSHDISCHNNSSYWDPANEFAGVMSFIKIILLLSPTVVFWLSFFYFRVPLKMSQNSIRLNRGGDGTLTTSNQFTYDALMPAYMQDRSYATNNNLDVSGLTTHNMRKSAFTNNFPVTKSIANADMVYDSK